MKVRVRFAATFRADYRAQLKWLPAHRDLSWIEGLRAGVAEARDLVSQVPGAGVREATDKGDGLRKLPLRRLPFVIWYAREGGSRDVWFLRLFHARQDRPLPDARGKARRKR